jgi:hypothetical protein
MTLNPTTMSFRGAVTTATRRLFAQWSTSVMLLMVWIAFIGCSYAFMALHEARMIDVVLSVILAIGAPVLFFAIQAMGATYTSRQEGAWRWLAQSKLAAGKLLVVSIPPALVLWLGLLLLSALHGLAGANGAEALNGNEDGQAFAGTPARTGLSLVDLSIVSLRFLLQGFVVPLLAISFWISGMREGIVHTLSHAHRIALRAFAPMPVLTYMLGAIFFAAIPYYLFFAAIHAEGSWQSVALLFVRSAFAFLLILAGWTVMMGTVSELWRMREEG